MDINLLSKEDVRGITRAVVAVLQEKILLESSAPVDVSNRHVHLCRDDMDILFGDRSELTIKKMLRQPGVFAAEECLTVRGKNGRFEQVRVLGPLRPRTQIDISVSDGFVLGVHPPVRKPGDIDGTPGIEIIGPKGTIRKRCGLIAAQRRIYLPPEDAERFGLTDGQMIKVEIQCPRGGVLNDVLVRVSEGCVREMLIDADEANAVGAVNGTRAIIITK